RKSIYNDLRDLEILGIEVEGEPMGNRYHYHVVNRPFELPELKLLVDAIHNAISENKKIKFQYYQWNVKKEMELRHNGAWYHISPWGLSWDDENYYLVGYDSDAGKIKHYRVDKMLHIQMSEEKREGKEYFKKLDMADYAKKSFGMFGGKEQEVKLRVANNLAGVIIDRFGKDVMMIPEDEDHFTVNVDVHVSKQFLGWIFSLGESVRIVGPSEVVAQMKEEIERLVFCLLCQAPMCNRPRMKAQFILREWIFLGIKWYVS
ncbi:helix-turn-helix transcriptional regulator, partial [Anaerostipes faecalis]|uniref:helix-turn-helix transcriptional regulator n=1 Tax=Anaerostipes faecalis TaxID=2738446 RepID=UPI003F0A1AFD